MIVLTINNSESTITGLSIEQFRQIKQVLSYKIPAASSYFSKGPQVRYLVNKEGTFPTGLLYAVKSFINTQNWVVTTKDLRKQPLINGEAFKLVSGVIPYEAQTAIVQACLKHHRGVISAPTGFGKSIAMALVINALQLKTLVVVPNLELKRQLTKTFTELFDHTDYIRIENIDSPHLKTQTDYDCLIIDECHHSAAKTYRKLNKTAWKSIYYRFSFTATPFRSRDEEQMLYESVAGQVIYTVDYQTAVKNKWIVPMEAYYVEIPKENSKVSYSNYHAAYRDCIVNNESRDLYVFRLLDSLRHSGSSVLGLVREVYHGDKISQQTGIHFTSAEDDLYAIKLKKFNNGELKVLLGTYGLLGEGVDTKICEFVVILTPVKSKNLFMQMCGRAFRNYPGKESCKIILIKDNSHKWFLTSFKQQVKILKDEYNIIPVKLEV